MAVPLHVTTKRHLSVREFTSLPDNLTTIVNHRTDDSESSLLKIKSNGSMYAEWIRCKHSMEKEYNEKRKKKKKGKTDGTIRSAWENRRQRSVARCVQERQRGRIIDICSITH